MGASVKLVSNLRRLEWEKTLTKRLIKDSLWGQLSNRTEVNSQVSNEGSPKVPDAVVNVVKAGFKMGSYSLTMPMLDKLREMGQGGFQSVKGNEERPDMLWKQVFYGVQRKGVVLDDQSVEGDLTTAYPILEQKNQLLQDYFIELNDYNKDRAVVLGADEFLTEQAYWNGTSLTAPPVAVSLNTNLLYIDQTAAVAWSATFATHMGNLQTALNTAYADAAKVFSKAVLDKAISWAHRKLTPLSWKGGSGSVKFVIMLSQYQADQLLADATTASGWLTVMTNAGTRGVDNRAISGIIGIYRETMIMVNPRAFTYNSASVAASAFSFVTPAVEAATTTVKGNGTGTCECALILGKNAIGSPMLKDISYHMEEDDYGFVRGFEARRSCGDQRMEWAAGAAYNTVAPVNQASAILFTPTPATYL